MTEVDNLFVCFIRAHDGSVWKRSQSEKKVWNSREFIAIAMVIKWYVPYYCTDDLINWSTGQYSLRLSGYRRWDQRRLSRRWWWLVELRSLKIIHFDWAVVIDRELRLFLTGMLPWTNRLQFIIGLVYGAILASGIYEGTRPCSSYNVIWRQVNVIIFFTPRSADRTALSEVVNVVR